MKNWVKLVLGWKYFQENLRPDLYLHHHDSCIISHAQDTLTLRYLSMSLLWY